MCKQAAVIVFLRSGNISQIPFYREQSFISPEKIKITRFRDTWLSQDSDDMPVRYL